MQLRQAPDSQEPEAADEPEAAATPAARGTATPVTGQKPVRKRGTAQQQEQQTEHEPIAKKKARKAKVAHARPPCRTDLDRIVVATLSFRGIPHPKCQSLEGGYIAGLCTTIKKCR